MKVVARPREGFANDIEYEDYQPLSFAVKPRLPAELSDEQRRRLLVVAGKYPVHKLLAHETPVVVSDRVKPL